MANQAGEAGAGAATAAETQRALNYRAFTAKAGGGGEVVELVLREDHYCGWTRVALLLVADDADVPAVLPAVPADDGGSAVAMSAMAGVLSFLNSASREAPYRWGGTALNPEPLTLNPKP